MKIIVLSGLLLISGAALADDVPRFDPEGQCDGAARLLGSFSKSTYNVCIKQQQDAYAEVRKAWPKTSDAVKATCIEQAVNSYQVMAFCIRRERQADAQPAAKFKF